MTTGKQFSAEGNRMRVNRSVTEILRKGILSSLFLTAKLDACWKAVTVHAQTIKELLSFQEVTMPRQPMQTDVIKRAKTKKNHLFIQKTISCMPSNTYSIINIILPEFGKKRFLKLTLWRLLKLAYSKSSTSIYIMSNDFFVMRVLLHYSVTWLVIMVVPRSLMSLILAELVSSYCFFGQAKLITDTLLWQFYLDDLWFSHYDQRYHKSKPKTRMNLPPRFAFSF